MTDIFLTHEGDLLVNTSTNDFEYAIGLDEAMQDIAVVVKTLPSQFALEPNLGASLYTLVGKLMTREVLHEGEDILYNALSGVDRLQSYMLSIRGVPVSPTEALFVIAIEDAGGTEQLYFIPFDFEHGLIESRATLDALKRRGVVDRSTDIIGIAPR